VKLTRNVYKLKEAYRKLSVPQFTIVTGLFIIFFGTLILSSPLCSSSKVGLWEAFFTSTSAITVTGLTIIDIGVDLNFFGQVFLAFMLLSGGLGLMAITTFLQGFVVKGTKLRTRLDKGKTLDEFGVGGIGRTFQSIAITAIIIISLGAIVLYSFGFVDIQNNWERLWSSIFHSISAYNNAGFSLMSNSLQDYRTNFLVNCVFVFLIVMGGLGWRVIDDIWSHKKNLSYKKLSLHSRLVIRTSLSLILAGSLGFFITESLLNSQVFNDLNVEVFEPFERAKLLIQQESEWAYDVARSNFHDLKECDCIFAIVNGNPPDEGVMIELGIAIALKKEIFLFRDDFRNCSDSDQYPLNLMLFLGLPKYDWEIYYFESLQDIKSN